MKMNKPNFIQITRFPLLLLLILYPLILSLFLVYGDLNLSSFYGVTGIFLIPLISALLVSYKEREFNLGMLISLKYHIIFVLIELFIFLSLSYILNILLNFYTVISIFAVFIFSHLFIGSLVSHFEPLHSKFVHKSIKEQSFSADHYIEKLGIFNLSGFAIVVMLLGLFFKTPKHAFGFLFFFLVFLMALDFSHKVKNDLTLWLVLSITLLISLYFYSIFSLIVVLGFVLTILTIITQRHSGDIGHHLVSWIFSLVYFFTTIMIFMLIFLLFDLQYDLLYSFKPILVLFLFSIFFTFSVIVAYFLILELNRNLLQKFNLERFTWPMSLIVKPSGNILRDSLIYGSLVSILVLLTVSVFILVMY
jgi:hypothetical protein